MLCKKCGKKLTGKQKKYCSVYCAKLFLKSEYRKRNKEKINAYKRKYWKGKRRTSGYFEKVTRPAHLKNNPLCEKCGTDKKLEVHHIKPLAVGGTHKASNLMTLCKTHHYYFEKRMKGFWE